MCTVNYELCTEREVFIMKKFIAFVAAVILAAGCCSCGTADDSSGASETNSTATESSVEKEVESCRVTDEIFDEYTSNTYLSTGNNAFVKVKDTTTYRAYIPVEEYGELEYKFYFSNTVDSTYNEGDKVYVGEKGDSYNIVSAAVYDGGTSPDEEPTGKTEVTFDGEAGRTVQSGETYTSDPVTVNIPEGHYLVWEWTIEGGVSVPGNNMSTLTSTTADTSGEGDDFQFCNEIPLPVFVGAKRANVTNRVMAIGDSITQGCQTDYMAFEYWAARIAQGLDDTASFWNCGLGWARTSDLSTCGDWLGRAVNCDTAIVAFGTNDIISGEYGGDGGNSAQEIIDYLTPILDQLKAAGVENIILFNAPPEDYSDELEAVRTEYNELLKTVAEEYGAEYFDFASYLCDPDTPSVAKYGGHPNGEGGQIVANAVLEKYFS
jgi:lysophospholipase L1-like esterase